MTEEQRKAKVAEIGEMVEAVAVTEPGKGFIRLLHDLCGYNTADRVLKGDGSINLEATALNSERRNVYLQIRSFVPPEVLRDIEIPLVTEEKK